MTPTRSHVTGVVASPPAITDPWFASVRTVPTTNATGCRCVDQPARVDGRSWFVSFGRRVSAADEQRAELS